MGWGVVFVWPDNVPWDERPDFLRTNGVAKYITQLPREYPPSDLGGPRVKPDSGEEYVAEASEFAGADGFGGTSVD